MIFVMSVQKYFKQKEVRSKGLLHILTFPVSSFSFLSL